MKLRTIMSLGALLIASTASANSYINFTAADITYFSNASGQRTSMALTATGNRGWNKYSQFLGAGERWVWTDANTEAVYLFNDTTKVAEKMVDFSDPIGKMTKFNLDKCTSNGMISQKGLILKTSAGTFTNVVRMTFSGNCADSGVREAYFAPKIGVIKWATQSIMGPVSYEITDGVMSGKPFGATPSTAIKVAATFTQTVFNVGSTPLEAGASLDVTNVSSKAVVLNFANGQEFEISLLDKNNRVLNTWGANKRFTQAERDVTIEAGKSRSFGGTITLQDLGGTPLATGQYKLRIELKDRSNTPKLAESAITLR